MTSSAFRDYPSTFPSHSRATARSYCMRNACFAGLSSAPELVGARILELLVEEGLGVFAGSPPAQGGAGVRPVYALSEADPPAVPTGRVFVQFEPGVDRSGRVRGAGYVVAEEPPYAPQAAWLVATDGSIASALRNLEALMALEGIVSVEPQMLRPAAQRGSR